MINAPRGKTGPGLRCPKCAHNTVTRRGDENWEFTQCSYCGKVWDSTVGFWAEVAETRNAALRGVS